MTFFDLSITEQQRRQDLVKNTRQMISSQLQIDEQDDTSIMTKYRHFYLQISFSECHPLMVFCLAKELKQHRNNKVYQAANDLNLRSVLGSHSINDDAGCYSYRSTHWLDKELDSKRFYEILDRCVDEADRGYCKLAC